MAVTQLIEHRLLREHRYAVVDASQREHVPVSARSNIIAPAFLQQDTGRCPLLVALSTMTDADHRAALETMLAQMQSREPVWFGVLIDTDADMPTLQAHLRSRIALAMPGQPTPVQFRYYDPHTLTQLPRLLGDAGMAWLMGPINAFTYVLPFTRQRVVNRIERPVNTQASEPFRINDQHRASLQALSIVNRALVELPPMADEAQWRDKAQAAEALRIRAQRQGLVRQADQVAFVLHGLTVHARFDQHPRIQALLKQLKAATADDELDYVEVTAALAPAEWQQIARDLTAAPERRTAYQSMDNRKEYQ